MRKSGRRLSERILSWILAIIMVIGMAGGNGSFVSASGLSGNPNQTESETTEPESESKVPETQAETKAPETKKETETTPETRAETKETETEAETEAKVPKTKAPKTKAQETKTVKIYVRHEINNKYNLRSATVTLKNVTSGAEVEAKLSEDGTYYEATVTLEGSYDISAEYVTDAFSIDPVNGVDFSLVDEIYLYADINEPVAESENSITYNLSDAPLKAEDIVSNLISEVDRTNGGYGYTLGSNDSNFHSMLTFTDEGTLKGKGTFQTGKTSVVIHVSVNGSPCKMSDNIEINVKKSMATKPQITILTKPEDGENGLLTNRKSVKFGVTGLTEDAGVYFYAKGGNLGDEPVQIGFGGQHGDSYSGFTEECSASAALSESYYLRGKITFYAKIEGNYDYGEMYEIGSETFYIEHPLALWPGEKSYELTYGAKEELALTEYYLYDGKTCSYSELEFKFKDEGSEGFTDESSVVSVETDSENHKYYLVTEGVGNTEIKVIRKQNDTAGWLSKELDDDDCISVKVEKLKLDPYSIEYDQTQGRYYNGDRALDVTASVKLDNGKEIPLTATLTLPSANQGTYSADSEESGKNAIEVSSISLAEKADSNNVTIKTPEAGKYLEKGTGEFKILPAVLTVSVVSDPKSEDPQINDSNDHAVETISYGDFKTNENISTFDDVTYNVAIKETTSEGGTKTVYGALSDDDRAQILKELAFEALPQTSYDVSDVCYEDIIEVNYTSEDMTSLLENDLNGNYVFGAEGDHIWGDLKVVSQKVDAQDVLKHLNYTDKKDPSNVFENSKADGTKDVWLNSNSSDENDKLYVEINAASDYLKKYDVVVTKIGEDEINLTSEGISIVKLKELGCPEKLTVQLAASTADGSLKNRTTSFDIELKYDSAAPEVIFKEVGTSTEEQGTYKYTFGAFTNLEYDPKTGGYGKDSYAINYSVEDGASGIDSVGTYILKLENGDFPTKAVIDLCVKDTANWSDGSFSRSVNVPKSDDKEGAYLVLVRATDKVSNEKIYVSNGVVIDITRPEISINGVENKLYGEDVSFAIEVNDPKSDDAYGTYAGIASVTYKVEAEINGETKTLLDETKNLLDKTKTYSKEEPKASDTITDKIVLENDYSDKVQITATVTDNAGNTATATQDLQIDTKAPDVKFDFDNTDAHGKNNKYYDVQKVLTIKVEEHNFDSSGVNLKVTSSLGEGVGYEFVGWTDEGDTHTATVTFKEDGDYSVSFDCRDKAGKTSKIVTLADVTKNSNSEITIDRENPTGNIQVIYGDIDESWKDLAGAEDVKNYLYSDKTVTVKMTASDVTSPYTIEYLKSDKPLTEAQLAEKTDDQWEKISDLAKGTEKIESYDVSYDEMFIPYMRVTDDAGNSIYVGSDSYVIMDNTAPKEPTITLNSKPAEDAKKEIFDNDVRFTISVEDPETNGAYSGIASVTYEVVAEIGGEKITTLKKTITCDDAHKQNFSIDDTVLAADNYSNNIEIIATVTDNAGNISEKSIKKLQIDNKAPEVSFNFDKSDVQNGKYYKNNKTLTITVDERNFDDSYKPTVDSSNGEGKGYDIGEWTLKDGKWTCDVTFTGDGDYSVTFDCVDFAGNKSDTKTLEKFTVDKTAPTGSIIVLGKTWTDFFAEKGNVKFDLYSNETVTVKMTAKDVTSPYTIEYLRSHDPLTKEDLSKKKDSDWEKVSELMKNTETEKSYTVSADEQFVPYLRVTDYAGNQIYIGPDSNVIVDKTAPVVTFAFDDSDAEGVDGKYYYNEKVLTITVDEHNFDPDVKPTVTSSVGETGYVFGGWENDGDTHTATVTFKKDGDYSVSFNCRDKAGNLSNTVTLADVLSNKIGEITIDRVKPTGKIQVVNGDINRNWDYFANANNVKFSLYSDKTVNVVMTAKDVTSPYTIEYLRSHDPLTEAQLAAKADDQWTKVSDLTKGTESSRTYAVPADEQFIPYMRVTDNAGHRIYVGPDSYVIADNTAPAEPTITLNATPSTAGIFNSDVPFTISVADPEINRAYAGIASVTYEVKSDGVTTQEPTTVPYDKEAHTQGVTINDTVRAAANYSNSIQIVVTVTDNAGNKSTSTKDLKIDNKAPIVSFSFDKSDVQNGKYYKNNKTLTITVDERNFDATYAPTVTSSAGGGYSFSGWSSNGEIHTGTVTFSGDSDFSVTFDCVDLANNKSNTETLEQFTVDKTAPVIGVSYSNNSVSNGKYYDAARTATITITEHNFNASNVQVTTTASLNGNSISAPTVSGWSTSGDKHTATIAYSKEGDFTFDITYTDLAGNASADYSQDVFTIDMTKPEITISGVADKSANKGTVAPVIEFSDINFNAQNVTLTLTGAKSGKVSTDSMAVTSTRGNGMTISFSDFAEGMDDIYTLTAKSVDRAGNTTEESITFSVNRDGSTYIISDATQKLLDKGITNTPQDIVITEINVDTLELVKITYSKDGKIITLNEGTDYTVSVSGGDGQWKEYTYTIKASCFDEEGEYTINIYSEDTAENQSTNSAKAKTVEFIVDKTAPSVSVANLENRGRYRESAHEFTLSVKDNMILDYVEIYLDGELWKTIPAEELEMENGQIVITVDSKNAYQDIKIVAYDAAGNAIEPLEYSVLITSNWWIQFFMNKPLFVGSIIALLVILGLIFFIIAKRRKKDEEKA